MDKPRVLRIVARLNIGGPAIHTILLTAGLGHFESVLATGIEAPHEGNMLDLAAAKGVTPLIIPELGREIHPLKDLVTIFKVYRLCRRLRPHVVHTHTAKAGFVGRLAAWLARVPIVVHTFHGHVFHDYFGPVKTRLFIAVERFLATITDRIVTVSPGQRREIAGYGVAPLDKITVIPLGFELDTLLAAEELRGQLRRELGLSNDTPLVGIVARLAAIKNHRLFLEAARLVAQRRPDVRFLVVGDGELRAVLERYAEEVGIARAAIFTGWRRDMPRIYADLDVMALTSLNEGTPVTLIEAMAAGVPVVATSVGGVPDVVLDKNTGLLVESGDAVSLAENVVWLLEHPAEANKMGKAGREAVYPKYASQTLLGNVEALYFELLRQR